MRKRTAAMNFPSVLAHDSGSILSTRTSTLMSKTTIVIRRVLATTNVRRSQRVARRKDADEAESNPI
jgi:hypothetical protein